MAKDKALRINNFAGIQPSYTQAFAENRNVDVFSVPGVAICSFETEDRFGSTYYGDYTFTVDTATDYLNIPSHGLVTGLSCEVSTTGTLPSPLTASTTYWIHVIDANNIILSSGPIDPTDEDKNQINITTSGSGTHTLSIDEFAGNVTKIIADPGGGVGANYELYAITDNDDLWAEYSEAVWAKITGFNISDILGAEIWKDYLFLFGSTAIDVLSLSALQGGTQTWTNSWQSLPITDSNHYSIVGEDDVLYISSQRFITSVTEDTTFDPTSGATYTYTAQALDLPSGYQIQALENLGRFLMIGAESPNFTKVFPWDRVSVSFNFPIRIPDEGIYDMINVNNVLYVVAGNNLNFYATDGTNAELFYRLPKWMFDQNSPDVFANTPVNRALAFLDGRIYITLNATDVDQSITGLWSLDVTNKNFVYEFTAPTERNSVSVDFNCIIAFNDTLVYGYSDSSESNRYRIGALSTNRRNASSTLPSIIRSGMIATGSDYQKRTFEQFGVRLAYSLTTGQDVTLRYRTSLNESFTELLTMSTGESVREVSKAVTTDYIEFEVEMTCSTVNSFTPHLMEIYAK